eukprot:s1545_g2.t1
MEQEAGDAFQQVGNAMPYPDEEEVAQNPFAARRAALGLVLVMTAPGIPMLLQGQEVCECRPFQWPHGPALDWKRVKNAKGDAATWLQLCRDLIALRTGKGHRPTCELGPGSPLQGDGVHVFLEHGGILAYLRWFEAEDSRERRHCRARLALVAVNWRNQSYERYSFGVPPSKSWCLALSVPRNNVETDIEVNQRPVHDFPCSIDVPIQALCEDIIRKSISIDNVVQIMMTAKAHRADGLKDICMDFIITNEEKIKPTTAFRELIQELPGSAVSEPTLMYELLMRRKPPK